MDVDDYIKIEKEDKAIEEEKAKEWTLSEKAEFKYTCPTKVSQEGGIMKFEGFRDINIYYEDDVREFIRRLKERQYVWVTDNPETGEGHYQISPIGIFIRIEDLDKLAGDKLR